MVLWSYDLINKLDQKRKIKKWFKYVVFVFKKFILRAALYKNHFFISVWEFTGFHLFTHTERVHQEGRQFNMTFIFSNHRRDLISPQRLMKTN